MRKFGGSFIPVSPLKYLSLANLGVFWGVLAEVFESWGFLGKNGKTWSKLGETCSKLGKRGVVLGWFFNRGLRGFSRIKIQTKPKLLTTDYTYFHRFLKAKA